MTPDHYAGAADGWAHGATIVYGPIAQQLVATSPHSLTGRVVLDEGAGTGVASRALSQAGANPIAIDLSMDMLGWNAGNRPPAAMADVCRLPLLSNAVHDVVSAFVLNHLTQPENALAEAARVTKPGGSVLACVYSTASKSEVRDAIDASAQEKGWQIPEWYLQLKATAVPLLGTAEDMARVAKQAGLVDVQVDEREVDVGVTQPEQLVDYRLGQAQFAQWLDGLGAAKTRVLRDGLVETIRPIMRPYEPVVVFLAAAVA